MRAAWVLVMMAAALAGCGNKPRQPDWLVNADSAQERYQRAYLSGLDRVADAEFARFRSDVGSTAQPVLVARAELTRCAMQVASLQLEECVGFERLRRDAPAEEQAYAEFLAGRLPPGQAALLPPTYRNVQAQGTGAAVQAIEDPASRLIAAGALFRAGRADPQVLQVAADTASAQGWRRAVIAWLGAQALRAERAGALEEAQRLRRRIALAEGDRP